MASLVVAVGLLLLGRARRTSATPITRASSPSRECTQLEVPVSVNATNYFFDYPRIDSNIDAVDWIWDLTTWSHGNTTDHITGVNRVNDTFTISAKLCVPSQGAKLDILQIASHGLGFDKRYWDFEIKQDEYSYVSAALRSGYSILTYDRLGTGNSTKADAYDVVQAGVEVEVLRRLTELALGGTLVSSCRVVGTTAGRNDTLQNYTPGRIVHVGHSYGSSMTSGLLSQYGNLSDGAILTGFLINPHLMVEVTPAAFGFEFAPYSEPDRFAHLPSGYVVQRSLSSIQQIFLKKGAFETELLSYAELIKQPGSVGQLVSGSQVFGQPAAEFKGPVQLLVGENDYPVCDGDCNGVWSAENISALYPVASNISVYLQPDTGHGLTLSTNATAGYQAMFSYLSSNGL